MGGCASGGNKDTEIDLFLKKHHGYNAITTDKNQFEISKQQWDPKHSSYIAKKEEDQYQINDETEQRLKEKQLNGEIDYDILQTSMSIANLATGSNSLFSSGIREPKRQPQQKTTKVVENFSSAFDGEYGTGGKARREPNPYLAVDMSNPDDPITFQGELQKFKPGFNGVYVDRWVQVTQVAIRYFASKPGSHIAAGKPLMAVPLIAVKSIERINQDLKLKKSDKKGKELSKHVFEILLKDDFLDLFLRPDYEQLFAQDTKRRNHLLLQLEKETKLNPSPSKKNVKELFIAEEENRGEEPLKQAAMQTLNTHGGAWSNRQGTWPLSERRLVFSSKKELVTLQWIENLQKVLNELNGINDSKIDNEIVTGDNGTIENESMTKDEQEVPGTFEV